MRARIALAGSIALLIAACDTDPVAPTAATPHPTPAASVAAPPGRDKIPGQYLVVLRDDQRDVPAVANALAAARHGRVLAVWESVLHGMSLQIPDAEAAALRADPRVKSVEQDQYVYLAGGGSQYNAPWNTDRIDQRAAYGDLVYNYAADGTGVTVYIVDSGIRTGHSDFEGRASLGYDATGGSGGDCIGHGTAVASVVGGKIAGVAKKTTLVSVRVFSCSPNGSITWAINGLNWINSHHVAHAVVNLSFGASYSSTENTAVQNLAAAGLTVVASAGPGETQAVGDACNTSPASAWNAIVVSGSDMFDNWAGYNYGPCVDLVAPGGSVYVADTTATGFKYLDGTSFAAPHVAGAAAQYLSLMPTATPTQVADALVDNATTGALVGVPAGTTNRLLYNGFIAPGLSPLVTTTIAGPRLRFNVATTEGDYTWTSTVTGGTGSYTYLWERDYYNTGNYSVVGTDPTLTQHLTCFDTGTFVSLRLTVRSGTSTAHATNDDVDVEITGPCG